MDFKFSEDQLAISELAESLFGDFGSDAAMAAHDESADAMRFDIWNKVVETGLHALLIPEDQGGSGLGMQDLLAVLIPQGKHLGQVPLWRHQLATLAISRFLGNDKKSLIEKMVAGESLGTLSLDAHYESQGHHLHLKAENQQTGLLSGKVLAVPLGDTAQSAILTVSVAGQPQLVLVEDLNASGITKVGGRSQFYEGVATLEFSNVSVSILPQEAFAWIEQRAIACLSALQLGVLTGQVARAVTYTSERQQFERAIGSFQAVQMTLADCFIDCEVLRTSLYQLVWRLDQGYDCTPQAYATKYLANLAGHRVGHLAQHVHGGIGVDRTYPIHRFLYWSRALSIALGSTGAHLERLGDWLANNNNLGWKYDLDEHQKV
jgi:alkylation response protein AidB-like acyl-CoA dehydrogenase